MRRAQTLEAKAAEVSSEIYEWAKRRHLLQPSETLVYSVRIENSPRIKRDPADIEAMLAMRAKDFFTRDRMLALGCTKNAAGRVVDDIGNASYVKEDGSEDWQHDPNLTLRQLLTSLRECRFSRKFYPHTVTGKLFVQTLDAAGIPHRLR
jgi:hypothetical protein